jgi:hypothetical protein
MANKEYFREYMRKRRAARSPEELERDRAALRVANLTSEQIERRRSRQRNLESKSLEKKRERSRRAAHRYRLKKKYGMTKEEWDRILKSQNFCCAICKSETSGTKRTWHVDHCHKTGKVRGLLCQRCNHLVGNAQDNIQLLMEAAMYLARSMAE